MEQTKIVDPNIVLKYNFKQSFVFRSWIILLPTIIESLTPGSLQMYFRM